MRLIEWMNDEGWPWAAIGTVVFGGFLALAATNEQRCHERRGRCDNYCNPYRVVKCDITEVWCGDGRHKVKP